MRENDELDGMWGDVGILDGDGCSALILTFFSIASFAAALASGTTDPWSKSAFIVYCCESSLYYRYALSASDGNLYKCETRSY